MLTTPARKFASAIALCLAFLPAVTIKTAAQTLPSSAQPVTCEILIVGGGFAGTAAAYEGLLAGRTVCMTEITDWVGGQVSAQGTSALDEAKHMRERRFFPRGYNELRRRIFEKYGRLSAGNCWVSVSCFLPKDGHALLWQQLQEAAQLGKGTLKWFPNTVIKDLEYSADGQQITSAIAIRHSPAPGTPPLNTEPLSQIIQDAYRVESSPRLSKQVVRFVPTQRQKANSVRSGEDEAVRSGEDKTTTRSSTQPLIPSSPHPPNWIVIEATETGEVIGLADIPYRLGLDPVSYVDPSSPVKQNDAYCTQGFTYTFAMERTAEPQPQPMPSFYPQYAPYFSFENKNNASIEAVFTYRRILATGYETRTQPRRFGVAAILPGDISMQNWTWGNDYRPGSAQDNLIYSRSQLQQRGELTKGGWQGGLRTETLRRGEENAIAYYHWLVAGNTDSRLGDGVKKPDPNYRYITGLESPMGTVHGLSKYPYIREARRIVGRPSVVYPDGFSLREIDVSQIDYAGEIYYQQNLPKTMYRQLRKAVSGLALLKLPDDVETDKIPRRMRSAIFPDSVGVAQYAIDFHPCMAESPPEKPGNNERPGVRQAHGPAYPGEVPLRAMIPQKIDNLIVAGKSIATSTIAAAAYRVHGFEWSVGAAAGTTADFALTHNIFPYELTNDLPSKELMLEQLQAQLETNNNPTQFPKTSIFNENWREWRAW
jgi:FAD dependent oxidoreductase